MVRRRASQGLEAPAHVPSPLRPAESGVVNVVICLHAVQCCHLLLMLAQLAGLYEASVGDSLLRCAIVLQAPPTDLQRPVRAARGLYVAGDHRDSATFDGVHSFSQ